MMIHHLDAVGHSSAKAFQGVRQERLELDWQTTYNSYDTAVFTMRHMETFMGDTRWKYGLTDEGPKQNTQIEVLKKKYVSKLTLHTHNMLKDAMVKEVNRFYSMNEEIRSHILRQAHDSRWERIA